MRAASAGHRAASGKGRPPKALVVAATAGAALLASCFEPARAGLAAFENEKTDVDASARALLGIDDDESDWAVDGSLDECHVERRERTAPWMAAMYRSMTGALLTLGASEAQP